MKRIKITGPCLPKVDPAEVAKALGASSVEPSPIHRTGMAPPLEMPKPEAPDLYLARLHAWLDGHDDDHPAPQVRSADISVRGSSVPEYVVRLCRDRPDGQGVFVRRKATADSTEGCFCDCESAPDDDHGETVANPCPSAYCERCGWTGTLPVQASAEFVRVERANQADAAVLAAADAWYEAHRGLEGCPCGSCKCSRDLHAAVEARRKARGGA